MVGGKENDYLCNLPNVEHFHLDYRDTKQLSEFVKDEKIDYIVPGCNDVSFQSYEDLSKGQSRSTISFENINNKKSFREICNRFGLPSPKIYNDLSELGPRNIIAKPEVGFSGKGVSTFHGTDPEQKIKAVIKNAEANSGNGKAILEDFITGPLFSIGVFIRNKEVFKSFVVKEYCLTNSFTVNWSFISEAFTAKINHLFSDTLKLLPHLFGIQNGHISLQCIIDDEDQIVIIEATFRCPGDLYPMLVELQTGESYSYNYLSIFLPENLLKRVKSIANNGLVVRHTTTFNTEDTFTGFYHHGQNVILSVPTLSVGTKTSPENKYRTGVHFYAMHKEPTLNELELLNKQTSKNMFI